MNVPDSIGGIASWDDESAGEMFGLVTAQLVEDDSPNGYVLVVPLPPGLVMETSAHRDQRERAERQTPDNRADLEQRLAALGPDASGAGQPLPQPPSSTPLGGDTNPPSESASLGAGANPSDVAPALNADGSLDFGGQHFTAEQAQALGLSSQNPGV